MAAQERNAWRIFGIVVIILLIAAAVGIAAFFIGRGCEGEEGQDTTTRTSTQPTMTSQTSTPPEENGQPGGTAGGETGGGETTTVTVTETTTETTATGERYVVGEGSGVSPCVGGVQTRTHTTYYSDGSTDTTTVTEPCTP
jgi:hypothetical protein